MLTLLGIQMTQQSWMEPNNEKKIKKWIRWNHVFKSEDLGPRLQYLLLSSWNNLNWAQYNGQGQFRLKSKVNKCLHGNANARATRRRGEIKRETQQEASITHEYERLVLWQQMPELKAKLTNDEAATAANQGQNVIELRICIAVACAFQQAQHLCE